MWNPDNGNLLNRSERKAKGINRPMTVSPSDTL